MTEQQITQLFVTNPSPLTENRIQALVDSKDVQKVLTKLVEEDVLKKHSFAPDLALYWPTNWYNSEKSSTSDEPVFKIPTTPSSASPSSSPSPSPKSSKEPVTPATPKTPQTTPKTSAPTTPTTPTTSTSTTPISSPETPADKKVNHLAASSSSLKARLAARKKKPGISPPSSASKPPAPSVTDNSESSTPTKSPTNSPTDSPSDSPSTSPATEKTTTKTANTTKASWLTTPSPKRLRIAPTPSNTPGKMDVEALEKEKKRLEDLVEQKEALIKKKYRGPPTIVKKSTPAKPVPKVEENLEELIHKWRDGCQQMLLDLQQKSRKPDGGLIPLAQLITMFQFDRALFPTLSVEDDCFG